MGVTTFTLDVFKVGWRFFEICGDQNILLMFELRSLPTQPLGIVYDFGFGENMRAELSFRLKHTLYREQTTVRMSIFPPSKSTQKQMTPLTFWICRRFSGFLRGKERLLWGQGALGRLWCFKILRILRHLWRLRVAGLLRHERQQQRGVRRRRLRVDVTLLLP